MGLKRGRPVQVRRCPATVILAVVDSRRLGDGYEPSAISQESQIACLCLDRIPSEERGQIASCDCPFFSSRIGLEKEVIIAYDCFRLFHQEVRLNATRKERRRIK